MEFDDQTQESKDKRLEAQRNAIRKQELNNKRFGAETRRRRKVLFERGTDKSAIKRDEQLRMKNRQQESIPRSNQNENQFKAKEGSTDTADAQATRGLALVQGTNALTKKDGNTDTSSAVAGGAVQGAATGAAFGGAYGAAIGAVVGGVSGGLKAKAAKAAFRRKVKAEAITKQGAIKAELHTNLAKISGEKEDRIQKSLSSLQSAFSRNLLQQRQVSL